MKRWVNRSLSGMLLAVGMLLGCVASAEVEGVTIELLDESLESALHADLIRLRDRSPVPVRLHSGVIGEVDRDGPLIYVDGLAFGFAPDAQVRLLGGFGAPTLLEAGMAVEFVHETDAKANAPRSVRVLQQVSVTPEMLH